MDCDDGVRGAGHDGTRVVSGGFDAPTLQLSGGRRVSIDAIHVEESLSSADIVYIRSAARGFDIVANTPTTTMPGWGQMPTFVVPPVSVVRDTPVLPRWKVWALLRSDVMEGPLGPLGGGSQLVLVFYCDDLAGSPITALIDWQLASLDEDLWRRNAEDWAP